MTGAEIVEAAAGRFCAGCGRSLEGRRPQTRTCGGACRVAAHRAGRARSERVAAAWTLAEREASMDPDRAFDFFARLMSERPDGIEPARERAVA